jgi:hypothetical protein
MWNWNQFKNLPRNRDLTPAEQSRQYFIYQSNMMYEASVNNTVAAAAAAAGAGAGGGGLRTLDFPEVIEQAYFLTWVDANTDTWKIVVYNYETGLLSDIIDTGLINDSDNQWYDYADIDRGSQNGKWNVHNKGFTYIYRNAVDDKYKIYFVNASGTLVGVKDLDNDEDFQYTENAAIFLGDLNGVSTCYHYDGNNVRTHTFDVDINLVEVDDASGEDCTADGSIIIESPNNDLYYIARPNGDLIDVSLHLINGSYRMDYNMNFISKYNSDFSRVKIVSQEGLLKNEFNLTTFNITGLNDHFSYGENCVYFNFSTTDGLFILSYDGDSNEFTHLSLSTLDKNYIINSNDFSYRNPKPKPGKHISLSNYSQIGNDSLGFIVNDLDLYWLPKGSTEFITHDFSNMGTFSFIDGFDYFTGNRTFTLGHNPIVMFGATNSDIQVGFMNLTGFSTASTGIQYASCSNIWGGYIGDNSYAIFDVDSTRIWQVYGTNSIIDSTETTSSWSIGTFDSRVHRNGTLCVIDSLVTENSFIYTQEIGLQQGPTAGLLYNSCNYAKSNYETLPEQVISKFIEGSELNLLVKGFYVLKLNGLSDLIEFPWGSSASYTIDNCSIGSDIISFSLIENITNNVRLVVYNKSTLNLIYDYIIDVTLGDWDYPRIWDNRCVIYQSSGETQSFRFVGKEGFEVLSLNSSRYNLESNDAEDNDNFC